MSEIQTKAIFAELPASLYRQVRMAAVREDKSLRQWVEEAVTAKLQKAPEVASI